MTVWDDRFDNHSLWTSTTEMEGYLRQVDEQEQPVPEPGLERCNLLVSLIRAHGKVDDRRLISESWMNQAQSHVQTINNHLAQWVSNPASFPTHIATIDAVIDQVLEVLSRWPKSQSAQVSALIAEAARLRADYERLTADMVRSNTASEATRDDLVDRFRTKITDLDTGYSASNSEAIRGLAALTLLIDQQEARLGVAVQRMDALATSQTTAFGDEANRRLQSFEEETANRRKEHEAQLDLVNSATADERAEQVRQTNDLIENIRMLDSRSQEIVGALRVRVG